MILSYLIKSALALVVFLVFYKLVLEREKMLHFNRMYLLFGLLFSLVVPFLNTGIFFEMKSTTTTALQAGNALIQETGQVPLIASPASSSSPVDVTLILGLVYMFIMGIFLMRFLKNLWQIGRKGKEAVRIDMSDSILNLQEQNEPPHTFMRNIFVHKKSYEERRIEETIIQHERAHARQLHSLDILLIELCILIFWFNRFLE